MAKREKDCLHEDFYACLRKLLSSMMAQYAVQHAIRPPSCKSYLMVTLSVHHNGVGDAGVGLD